MPGLEGWDVHLRESTFSLNIYVYAWILARGGMDTVLISAALAAGTVESLWKSPQQLQWLANEHSSRSSHAAFQLSLFHALSLPLLC